LKSRLSHIIIDQVSKKYKASNEASLEGISMRIDANEKFGILGPNGAGKTTLISIMCGLLDATAGSVSYYNQDQEEISGTELKTAIGFVPQDYAFYHELTPLQNLDYFGAMYNLSRDMIVQRSDKLLAVLGLSDVAKKKVGAFSGGMKRRVNLAIGLLHDPSILFLDEPTVGVDVQSKFAIMQFLEGLSASTTIIYTSHHLAEAENFCDSIALLDHGKLLAMDRTKSLIAQHGSADLETLFINLTGEGYRDQHV